jgi:hypothetical protein
MTWDAVTNGVAAPAASLQQTDANSSSTAFLDHLSSESIPSGSLGAEEGKGSLSDQQASSTAAATENGHCGLRGQQDGYSSASSHELNSSQNDGPDAVAYVIRAAGTASATEVCLCTGHNPCTLQWWDEAFLSWQREGSWRALLQSGRVNL